MRLLTPPERVYRWDRGWRAHSNGVQTEPINDEALEQGPVDLGEVAVTDAYELAAEIVIHAAAMPHYGDRSATPESVRAATENALLTADNRACSSMVIPVLGTGVAGLEFETGARVICTTIDAFEPTSLTEVRVIAYEDDAYETLERIAREIRGDSDAHRS